MGDDVAVASDCSGRWLAGRLGRLPGRMPHAPSAIGNQGPAQSSGDVDRWPHERRGYRAPIPLNLLGRVIRCDGHYLRLRCFALVVGACSGDGSTTTTTAAPTNDPGHRHDRGSNDDNWQHQRPPPKRRSRPQQSRWSAQRGSGPNFQGQSLASGPSSATSRLLCATFDDAELAQPTFSGADLSGASFVGASISQGTFQDASLIGVDFTGCRSRADPLQRSRPDRCACWPNANLAGGRFEGATCPDGTAAGVDLRRPSDTGAGRLRCQLGRSRAGPDPVRSSV